MPYVDSDGAPLCDPAGDRSPAPADLTCNSTQNATVYFGAGARRVKTEVLIGNDTIEAEACFQRISRGDLYWPPTSTITCP